MTQLLNIHSIGYTANNNPNRARRGGEEFEEIIPAPAWREEVVKRNASVDQTVGEMQKVIRDSAWQTKQLSQRLLGKDIYSTCGNIWEFLYSHIRYKEDDKGQEQLRTPALSWYLRRKRGIDCDDFSIFCSTILYNLNIPHYLRCARYEGKDYFQHVYVVAPLKDKKYITIDAVLDQFDAEKPTAETKDFLVMNNDKLNGIDVSVLSGIDEDTLNEISGVLEGLDFENIGQLEGLEGLDNVDELEGLESEDGEAILGAIYNHLRRTREVVRNNPHFISTVEDPQLFGDMLDYGLRYWNTDKREEALGVLAEKEDELNGLLGLDRLGESGEETQLFYGIEGLGGISVLGKVKAKKQFFNNIKKTVQKVGQKVKKTAQRTSSKVKSSAKKAGAKAKKVAKKVGRAVIKYNPVSLAARGGMLAAMKTNLFKIAEKLKWGYLTQAEAQDHGFDMAEWAKSKAALTKTENLFVNTLKGSAQALKKAILTGRAGGLNGLNEELGVVTAAAAGASMTAAMPFIKKIADFVKLINPAKLIAKVKAKRLAKKQKKADEMPESPEDAQSAQPDVEGGNEQSQTPEESAQTTNETGGEKSEKTEAGQEQTPPAEPGGEPTQTNEPEKSEGADKNNLPAAKGAATNEPGIVGKAANWVMENKGMSLLMAGGLILLFSEGARKTVGLGKVRKSGKKHKGKNKKNPPKAISGVPKKNHKPKYKNNSRKGKDGGPKRVTL